MSERPNQFRFEYSSIFQDESVVRAYRYRPNIRRPRSICWLICCRQTAGRGRFWTQVAALDLWRVRWRNWWNGWMRWISPGRLSGRADGCRAEITRGCAGSKGLSKRWLLILPIALSLRGPACTGSIGKWCFLASRGCWRRMDCSLRWGSHMRGQSGCAQNWGRFWRAIR